MRPRNPILPAALFSVVFLGFAGFGPAQTSQKKAPQTRWEAKDYSQFLEIPGAERLGSDQCQACHGAPYKSIHHTAHGLRKLDCEDCHGNGSLHPGSKDYKEIIQFRERTAEQANGVCLSCHAKNEGLLNWQSGRHASQNVKCIDCHQVHAAETKLATFQESNAKCESCHHKEAAQSKLPYHHPTREGKMACADCHDPHGGAAANNLRGDSVNQLCFQCHTEYEGPFTYQHAPVVENCTKCHTSHGSVNRSLLTVSQPMLCLQCHAAHHNGAGIPLLNQCTSCHSSIHGSDVPSATGGSVFIDKP
jgi:DmsE family decaheme c-type cytochrome